MSAVFLSASFPSGDRGEEVRPFFPADIAAATAAAVEATLRSGARLVFGGHPTITPIVLQIASALDAGPQVEIFQSRWFASSITEDAMQLVDHEGAHLVWVDAPDDDLGPNLLRLRRRMFSEPVVAAFFVGGMSGVQDEFDLLGEQRQEAVRHLVETPGGMAGILAAGVDVRRPDTETVGELWTGEDATIAVLRGRPYASLARRALARIGLGPADDEDEV